MTNKAFAFRNKKDIVNKSSSGGAFTAIVDILFENSKNEDIVVFGAAFDENFYVTHQEAKTKEQCAIFRGSKYVHSKLGDTATKIKQYLINGDTVLFSGTPCQVHAIREYLKKYNIDDTKLYCIDIICHGAPNQKLWIDFKKWLEDKNKSKLEEFSFRYSKAKWKDYACMARFRNKVKKINSHDVRLFTELFFTELIMSEKCYSCKFANMNRVGDITLGDFWGIKKVMPNLIKKNNIKDTVGISLVISNNQKGTNIINNIKKQEDIILEECISNEYIKYQNNLNYPIKKPKELDDFRNDYKNNNFEYIAKKYGGYNLKGKVFFKLKKFLNETGLIKILRKFR